MKNHPSLKQHAAYAKGVQAEKQAIAHLESKGYRLIASRYICSAGEIDMIMEHADTLVFVEVKARASTDEALYSLSSRQMKRILSAAEIFMSEHHAQFAGYDMRFDVITLDAQKTITHFPHAFNEDNDYSAF